jgi:hypothetical protein
MAAGSVTVFASTERWLLLPVLGSWIGRAGARSSQATPIAGFLNANSRRSMSGRLWEGHFAFLAMPGTRCPEVYSAIPARL